MFLTTFGVRPGLGSPAQSYALAALGAMLLGLLANLVCIWTIPNWKLRIRTGCVRDGAMLRLDLGLTTWITVGSLLLGFVLSALAAVLSGEE